MPYRFRVVAIAALMLTASVFSAVPAAAVVVPQKVVIIVGPVGSGTDNYRQNADQTAAAAEAAGATVVKVYSPNATWANVRAAVAGANIVIYMGHGNGYPSPYSTTENRDRVNGWGLNRTAGVGDGDNWSTTMVYCGEKAILGTLTSSDGAAQWSYCGGSTNTDGISPAPNWVMIYGNACYAPGAGESWDTPATESVAYERVRNYSYPALAAGASAYYASDLGTADLVTDILQNPSLTWTDITRMKNGYDEAAQRHFAHPDVANAEVWIQRTSRWGGGSLDYLFAFAGNPLAKPEGGFGATSPVATSPSTYVALSPARLLDTRVGNGLSGAFSAGVARTFQVTGRGGVPANAIAVSGNLTVTGQTAAGYVYLGPLPTPSPSSSTLNFPLGDDRANAVTVALSPTGSLSATYAAAAGSTQLVFDVTGYFVP